jgi:hypothetical protein
MSVLLNPRIEFSTPDPTSHPTTSPVSIIECISLEKKRNLAHEIARADQSSYIYSNTTTFTFSKLESEPSSKIAIDNPSPYCSTNGYTSE